MEKIHDIYDIFVVQSLFSDIWEGRMSCVFFSDRYIEDMRVEDLIGKKILIKEINIDDDRETGRSVLVRFTHIFNNSWVMKETMNCASFDLLEKTFRQPEPELAF